MKKLALNSIYVLTVLIGFVLAGCATQPQTTSSASPTTTNSSPMNRDNGNGLASVMH